MKPSAKSKILQFQMSSPTIAQIIESASQRLAPVNASARLDAEILVAHGLNFSRTQLYTWANKELKEAECSLITNLIHRRYQGEPIAYIVGYKEFWSLNFKVTQDTLIPRPDTELLVELALEKIPTHGTWQIADLGTGSGAIAIAIGKERPHCQILAVDKSEQALQIAIENAHHLNVNNIVFCQSNWFSAINEKQFDLIVSNPPYIATHDKHLIQGDLISEPRVALASGVDGLKDLREIISCAKAHLKPGANLLLEHGYDQATIVRTIFKEDGYNHIHSHLDLSSIERVTLGLRQ